VSDGQSGFFVFGVLGCGVGGDFISGALYAGIGAVFSFSIDLSGS
tara:strand:+ start:1517 stop:1651 length:135 start_codon:yes stop_codon:yes gene_type:complete